MTPLSFKFAYRHVRAGFSRVALSIVAIALGVGLVVAFQLMNAAVLDSFLDTMDAMAGRAGLTVSVGEGINFPEETVEAVSKVAGVKLAVPLVRGTAFPDDDSGEVLTVQGVDLTREAAVRLYHDAEKSGEVIDDLVEFLNSADSIILGAEFAKRRGIRKGDAIDLVTPTGVKKFRVRGLLEAQGLAQTLQGRLVVMDLLAAERVFAADGQINQIDVVLAEGAKLEEVKAGIGAVVAAGLRVEEPELRKTVVRRTLAGFQAMITAFSLLSVLAGFIICYSRLRTVFEQRTWEVGLLRAVGLRQGQAFWEMMKEGLLYGVVGTAIGLGLGTVLARYALPYMAATTSVAMRMQVGSAQARMDMWSWGMGVMVGLGAALGAAVMPARRLSTTQPVAALRMQGREVEAVEGAAVWTRPRLAVLAGLGLVGVVHWFVPSVVLGHVLTGMIGLAVCACARPLVVVSAGPMARVFESAFGCTGRLAAGELRQRAGRTALTVATIGVGVGTVIMIGVLGVSLQNTVGSMVGLSHRAQCYVASALTESGYLRSSLADIVIQEIAAVPGVELAAGAQSRDVNFGGNIIPVKAFDAATFSERRLWDWSLETRDQDALQEAARGRGALVTVSYASQQRVGVGDTLVLPTPDGPYSLPIVGISNALPENAVVIERALYKRLWRDSGVVLIYVAMDQSWNPQVVRDEIAARVGKKYRLDVRLRQEIFAYFDEMVGKAFEPLYGMDAVIFSLLFVALGDTLASSVMERTRALGMMRAVGLSRKSLCGLIVAEGLGIGMSGLFLATVGGVFLSVFWVKTQFPAILGWSLDLHFPLGFAAATIAATLALCAVASLLPALRAGRMSVPAALRNE